MRRVAGLAFALAACAAASCRGCKDEPKIQKVSPEEEALRAKLAADAGFAPATPPITTSTRTFTATTTSRPEPPPVDPWVRVADACGGSDLGLRERFTPEEVEAACRVSKPITDVTVIGRITEWRKLWGEPACPIRIMPGEILGRVMLGMNKGRLASTGIPVKERSATVLEAGGYRATRNAAGIINRAEVDLDTAPPCVRRGDILLLPELTPESLASTLANCEPPEKKGATTTVKCETGAVQVTWDGKHVTLAVTRPAP